MTETEVRPEPPATDGGYDPGDRWVPVDRRWLGIDRRTITPALLVFVLATLMAVVVPAIDELTSYDDEVLAGDVIQLDEGITFVPPVGWGITSGVRASDRPRSGSYPEVATVVDGDVAVRVRTVTFDGDADALFEQMRGSVRLRNAFEVIGEPETVMTASGERGVGARVVGDHSDGVVAAIVIDGIGVEVVATGSADLLDNKEAEISGVVTSIRGTNGGGR